MPVWRVFGGNGDGLRGFGRTYVGFFGYRVELAPGVDYVRTADVKDQIELSGNDIQAVSMTGERRVCAL